MIELKKIYWLLIVATIIISIFVGNNLRESQKTLDEAKALKTIFERQYEAQRESCYLRVADGSCIALSEIGVIERTDVDTLCVQLNCTNQTERSRAVASLIMYNNFTNKKIILLH